MKNNSQLKYLEFIILLLLLFSSGYLRFINLENNPGLYSDEGTQIELAQNLVEEEIQYYSINQSTFIIGRLPLFSVLLFFWGSLAILEN